MRSRKRTLIQMDGSLSEKATDRFMLKSKTSRMAAGGSLVQFQLAQRVLNGYHSKKLL